MLLYMLIAFGAYYWSPWPRRGHLGWPSCLADFVEKFAGVGVYAGTAMVIPLPVLDRGITGTEVILAVKTVVD